MGHFPDQCGGFGCDPAQMLLVAVHPWNIDGAARAGMATGWVNRAAGFGPSNTLARDRLDFGAAPGPPRHIDGRPAPEHGGRFWTLPIRQRDPACLDARTALRETADRDPRRPRYDHIGTVRLGCTPEDQSQTCAGREGSKLHTSPSSAASIAVGNSEPDI